jgi:nicotinamidase-related amidase
MTTTTYAADRTALLIVDPYNDFMSEGDKLYEATKETAEAVGFYGNMHKLIPAIRAARIQVVIVPHHRWREGDYKGWKHMNPSQVRANQAQGFAAGSWGGEFHPEFGPHHGDVVVLEDWAQSGFAKLAIDPGETKTCMFRLTADDLALYDKDLRRVVEPGQFRVMVGSSSEDIRLTDRFEVK